MKDLEDFLIMVFWTAAYGLLFYVLLFAGCHEW